jgi:hypothetical protein
MRPLQARGEADPWFSLFCVYGLFGGLQLLVARREIDTVEFIAVIISLPALPPPIGRTRRFATMTCLRPYLGPHDVPRAGVNGSSEKPLQEKPPHPPFVPNSSGETRRRRVIKL